MSQSPREVELELSVVMISWNTRELLLGALRSLFPLRGVRAEVLVVDNASSDGSAEAAEEAFGSELLVIRNDRNLGFAGGVNVGLRHSHGQFILLLNTDTVVLGDAVRELVDYARRTPQAGIVGPRVLNADGSLQDSCFRFPSLLNLFLSATYANKLFPNSAILNRERLTARLPPVPAPVEVVSGCSFLIRRECLERVGMIDERFFMYAEEADFCFRAAAAGFQTHYLPSAQIIHFRGGSSRLAPRRNFLEFRRSMLRFFWKHHGRRRAQLARAGLILWLALRLPYWSVEALRARPGARSQLQNYMAGIRFLARPLERILAPEEGH